MEQRKNKQTPCKYWCYSCEKYYELQSQANYCLKCDSDAIEFVQNTILKSQQETKNASKFQIFEIKQNIEPEQENILGVLQNFDRPNMGITTTITTVQSYSINLQDIPESSYLSGLLRQLMMGENRLTPANQSQIQRLQKITKVKQCSICQHHQQGMEQQQSQIREQQSDQGLKLPCAHTFHSACIKPWFQRTNTCPICRTPISDQN